MSAAVEYLPLRPWVDATRELVARVVRALSPLDARELYAIRPEGQTAEQIVRDVGRIMGSGLYLEGFVAAERENGRLFPAAVALAWAASMPRTAHLAFFGRADRPRALAATYRELGRRRATFGIRHDCLIAGVPVLTEHATALRRLERTGGRPAYDYGPVGRGGEEFTHWIWRF